jgi:uncharacterized membrane protein YgcG
MKNLLIIAAMLVCTSAQAQTVTYWLEPGGYMAEISSAETHRRIKEALVEIEDIADVRFVQVANSRSARIRYYFRPQSQIKYGALGLANIRAGYIELNNTRKVGLTRKNNRICQSVAQHEMLHMLWTPLHSARTTSVMHAGSIPKYFDRQDVSNLQKVFGRNATRKFRPVTLGFAGNALRESTARYNRLWEERMVLLAERDGSTDKVYRTAKQMEIIDNIIQIIAEIPVMVGHAQDWFSINLYWKTAYGYVNGSWWGGGGSGGSDGGGSSGGGSDEGSGSGNG